MRQQRLRKILVGAQVALSVTLLAGAALLITSFMRLSQQNLGFQLRKSLGWRRSLCRRLNIPIPDRVSVSSSDCSPRCATVPGVESATVSGDIPLDWRRIARFTRAPIAMCRRWTTRATAPSHDVAPDIFKTWGIPLLAGREFDEHDTADSQNVVSDQPDRREESFPQRKSNRQDAAGDQRSAHRVRSSALSATFARNVSKKMPDMEFYRPWAQENFPFVNIAVRSNLKYGRGHEARAISAERRSIPAWRLRCRRSMDTIVAQALGQARLMMWLLGIFAGVAVLLASIGIYGAVAYSVEQRTGEIGVRMALGAQTRDVLRLIVNQGMRPVVIGLAIGIVSAFALGRLLTSQLYEVSAHNPALLAASTILLAAIALIACLVPARRAAHVDPIQALRAE